MTPPLEIASILSAIFCALAAVDAAWLEARMGRIIPILDMTYQAQRTAGDRLCFAQRLGARGLLQAAAFNLQELYKEIRADRIMARREIEDALSAIAQHRDDLYPESHRIYPAALAYEQLLGLLEKGAQDHPDLQARAGFWMARMELEMSIYSVQALNAWLQKIAATADKGMDKERWQQIGEAGFAFGTALIQDAKAQNAQQALQNAAPAGEG